MPHQHPDGVSHESEQVLAADGERLFVRRWRPLNGEVRAALILSHGLAEHSDFYLPLVGYFAPRGAAIYAQDHRGFGRSGGRRGHVERYARYVEDLVPLVERARSENPGLPVALVGHSMGGTIAILFALRHPDLLDCAVFSAPALVLRIKVPARQRLLVQALARVYPTYTDVAPLDPTVLTSDLAQQQIVLEDPYRHTRRTMRLAYEMFKRAPDEVLSRASELRVPFLIIHGTVDPLVSEEGSQIVYEAATLADRNIRLYQGLLHEPFRELQRETVFADVATWLREHGVPLAAEPYVASGATGRTAPQPVPSD